MTASESTTSPGLGTVTGSASARPPTGPDGSVVHPPVAVAAPWFGRPREHRHAVLAGLGSLVACGAYWQATRILAPDVTPGLLEFTGTLTSLWAVWITQRRNVLAQPIGIVSVLLMGWFFLDLGLAGQTLLHWAYYVPVQVWGWWMWTRGGRNGGELVVTRSTWRRRLVGVGGLVVATGVVGQVLAAGWDDAVHTSWDASIVAASVLAQYLLSRKKVESWWLWIGPVNVSAIGLYVVTGATMFAALYVLFLSMAVVGLLRWHRAADAGQA